MTSAGVLTRNPTVRQEPARRTLRAAFDTGVAAVGKFAEAERLRAEAVAELVEFHAIDGHATAGFCTPQRQLVVDGRLSNAEANRLVRLVRFVSHHPLIADQLEAGLLTVDHADVLYRTRAGVDPSEFAAALPDLLAAAAGVELSVFRTRMDTWRWRVQPEVTADELDEAYDRRRVNIQAGLFGGMKGSFDLDPAASVILAQGLATTPDASTTIDEPRTLAQRQADRLRVDRARSACRPELRDARKR